MKSAVVFLWNVDVQILSNVLLFVLMVDCVVFFFALMLLSNFLFQK